MKSDIGYYFILIFLFCILEKAFVNGINNEAVNEDDEKVMRRVVEAFSAGLQPKKSSSSLWPTTIATFKSEKDIDFLVYKRHDINKPDRLKFNSVVNSEYVKKEWTTLIFIHGWKSSDIFLDSLKKGYWARDDNNINVIEVNWSKGANSLAYLPSVNRVMGVGRTVAKFIQTNLKHIDLDKLIIVGHSLGAHAAGHAGKFLKQNKLMAQQIVGLDPAGVNFQGQKDKLESEDARNVIVIHSSSTLGHLKPLGTLDIYINGGKQQPNCSLSQSHRLAKKFYENLFRENKPIVGYKYASFEQVRNGEIPKTGALKLFHGEPFPSKGTLVYVSTNNNPRLIPKLEVVEPKEDSPSCVGSISSLLGSKRSKATK